MYRLTVQLPGGFDAVAGQRYWLEIAEDDSDSLTANADDFRWSAHRPAHAPTCWALQAPPAAPLPLDVCDNQQNELAFVLRSKVLHVVVAGSPFQRIFAGSWNVAILNPAILYESGLIEFDPTGHGYIEPDAADGSYRLEIYVPGSEPIQVPIQIADGTETVVPLSGLCIGDCNGDGVIDFEDVNAFVACLSAH